MRVKDAHADVLPVAYVFNLAAESREAGARASLAK